MQDNEKKPALRFKGFTDPWEQRKLGEMVDVCSGMDYKHLSEGDIPVYGTGGYMLSVNKALSYDRNAVGIGRKGTIDKPYILKAPFWTVDTLFYAIPKDSKNIDFTFDVFQKVDWKKKDESTGVPSLSKIAINETSISTPSKLEQERIGSFFRNLDTLITLHQRKYEKLVNIKKSMLDKMFPQNGASVPEIRFKSFTDPWEQRKLGEAFDFTVPNNMLSRAELNQESGSVRNVHYGDVLIKYGSVLDAQNDELPFITGRSKDDFKGALLQNGDIIIADTAEDETTGKVCEIVNIQDKDVVAGLHTMVCRPKNKTAEGYFGYYMNSSSYHHQLLPLMQGIKVLSLSKTNVQKTTVKYPKDKAEQQKIADCLRRIDALITLHQRKLEKLQNIKKSCLEKMFV